MVIDVSATEFGVKGLILEETEISRALFELYEGAIVSWATSISMLLPHRSSIRRSSCTRAKLTS